jgi:hypothetical protein
MSDDASIVVESQLTVAEAVSEADAEAVNDTEKETETSTDTGTVILACWFCTDDIRPSMSLKQCIATPPLKCPSTQTLSHIHARARERTHTHAHGPDEQLVPDVHERGVVELHAASPECECGVELFRGIR